MSPIKVRSDTDILHEILQSHYGGGWVSHKEILRLCDAWFGHGMTVHSRAADLRKRGFTVECKVERHNGRARSYYRLVAAP